MRDDLNQYGFDFAITFSGESGKQIKNRIVQRLRERSPNSYPFDPFIIDYFDLELNDPLYIYIDEFIKFSIIFYPERSRYNDKSRIRYFDRREHHDDFPKISISNFRQREGSLEVTFELIIETAVYYGALRAVIDYLIRDLEVSLESLAGDRVKIDVRDKSTRIKFRGSRKRFKIKNWILRLSTTVALIILAFAIVYNKTDTSNAVDKEQIKAIVKETIEGLSAPQAIKKDSVTSKVDSLKLKK
jgi:hypothetical protein